MRPWTASPAPSPRPGSGTRRLSIGSAGGGSPLCARSASRGGSGLARPPWRGGGSRAEAKPPPRKKYNVRLRKGGVRAVTCARGGWGLTAAAADGELL